MKITVFGASGRTGLLLVFQALNLGHEVTAYARTASKVTISHKNIRIIEGDLGNREKLREALRGQDVVICTLGINENKPSAVLSEGTGNILQAMEECSVKRFICMSSAGVENKESGFMFDCIIRPLFLRHIFQDKKRQIEVIRNSKAEWVIVRPVRLTDSPKTGRYKVNEGKPASSSVPRADVADFMLKLMTDHRWDYKLPAVAT